MDFVGDDRIKEFQTEFKQNLVGFVGRKVGKKRDIREPRIERHLFEHRRCVKLRQIREPALLEDFPEYGIVELVFLIFTFHPAFLRKDF